MMGSKELPMLAVSKCRAMDLSSYTNIKHACCWRAIKGEGRKQLPPGLISRRLSLGTYRKEVPFDIIGVDPITQRVLVASMEVYQLHEANKAFAKENPHLLEEAGKTRS